MVESREVPESERRIWELLTQNFTFSSLEDFGLHIHGVPENEQEPTIFQIFEVTVAAIFAKLRPNYTWSVTPNRPDGGLDFLGESRFLHDETLGISAAITVGGQCKKRSRVDNVAGEVSGSLVNMIHTVNPTFLVVALSARLTRERVDEAVEILRGVLHRHCHILDRVQIEGLIAGNLALVANILSQALDTDESAEVISYFRDREPTLVREHIQIDGPETVLAGEPFHLRVRVDLTSLASTGLRYWWRRKSESTTADVVLLLPIGAEATSGAEVTTGAERESPIHADVDLEFLTYGTGETDLGEIAIGPSGSEPTACSEFFGLGTTVAVENMRPRFYPSPFDEQLKELSRLHDQALASGLVTAAVVGAGGSGKTRVSEEFALERRRRGSYIASARQAQSLNDPHRLFADLLLSLARLENGDEKPADQVVHALARYDVELASQAEGAIRSIFGMRPTNGAAESEQPLLSALLVLLVVRSRESPVVVHLQDLHWCPHTSLHLLEKLIWQLEQLNNPRPQTRVLLLLEGRIKESFGPGSDWSTGPFESFVQRVGCARINCRTLTDSQASEFTKRLFEDRFSSNRQLLDPLFPQQEELIQRILRSVGGNPFHSLEQAQLLRQHGVIARNQKTGLFYLVRAGDNEQTLPHTVLDSITARWRYLREHDADLGLLFWAVALLDDSVPMSLFRHLWSRLAPQASLTDINATGMMLIRDPSEPLASFRHENYVRALRRLEVGGDERQDVLQTYDDWYSKVAEPGPIDDFRWAHLKLQSLPPHFSSAQMLMTRAKDGARSAGDVRLARRVSIASLDAMWLQDVTSNLPLNELVVQADDEIALVREMREVDVSEATPRVIALRKRLSDRLKTMAGEPQTERDAVELRYLTCCIFEAKIQFVSQQPEKAVKTTESCLAQIAKKRRQTMKEEWEILEMECLHSLAVAKATSGETAAALELSAKAAAYARDLDTRLADGVIGSYGTLLSSRDLDESEEILRDRLKQITVTNTGADAWSRLTIFLAMTLIQKYYLHLSGAISTTRVDCREAKQLLDRVFDRSNRLGQYPDAGASALMLGIVSVLNDDGKDTEWFAKAVAAAGRGRQLETLWRAHLNLATSLARSNRPGIVCCEHSLAALDLMEESLSDYSEPERSPRFEMLRVPLTRAVQFLVLGDRPNGVAAIRRFPRLAQSFSQDGTLLTPAGWRGRRHYQRFEFDSDDYFTY